MSDKLKLVSEMLIPPIPNEDRIVPYITELSDLLNESFIELDTEEEILEQLKTHFITQFPQLESLTIQNQDQLQEFYLLDFIQSHSRNENVWKKLQR